jgi:hypothetical protein
MVREGLGGTSSPQAVSLLGRLWSWPEGPKDEGCKREHPDEREEKHADPDGHDAAPAKNRQGQGSARATNATTEDEEEPRKENRWNATGKQDGERETSRDARPGKETAATALRPDAFF